ncbi:MAG: TetR/AcrR family transcriptional regulator [Treponema sp.]|jgi:AcrR family transcriptional regulator|nr:TetR/AcrR family transcriptional regulator [Treponema sp.]
MSKPETDLAPRIREKTLDMLLEKEPEEISTRDIAKACGVTATSLYYYYKDKEALFTEIKLMCIEKMDATISAQIARETALQNARVTSLQNAKKIEKTRKQGKKMEPLAECRAGLEAFRDWAFANPRIALLVMGRLKADTQADPEKMKKYYQSTSFAKTVFDRMVQAGVLDSKDTLLDASLCIAALWGAIEMVLLNRTVPQYWTKSGAVDFTDKMIDLLMTSLMSKNRQQ